MRARHEQPCDLNHLPPAIAMDELEREAHVWLASPETIGDSRLLRRFRNSLSDEESSRMRRLKIAHHRHSYLVAHGLLRHTLSRYVDIAPEDWKFSHGRHGRPEIANPSAPPLRFNLTHTEGLTGCIVTLHADCGIDAEQLTTRHATSDIARRMFSEEECRELERLPAREHTAYFFEHWTLREAYVKAIGTGISFPTNRLRFVTGHGGVARVLFQPDIDDHGDDWQFRLLRPTDEHVAAVAVRKDGNGSRRILTRFLDPEKPGTFLPEENGVYR
ncbi:MAG TPA: 4'-phosphopantetheinyl transferase superfamily protein [Gammaproteobacteria bacterium]|nr:4'-phosphopantetheinyl transferase superfamily protein [Gammaproteobacteria bacterium]